MIFTRVGTDLQSRTEVTGLNKIFCGIDWAEGHHDIALVDQDGTQVAKLRISDDSAGFHALIELLTEHGDSTEDPIPVAIETPRGLLVAGLRATGLQIYAINPLAAAQYRDRGSVPRAKSSTVGPCGPRPSPRAAAQSPAFRTAADSVR